MDSKSILQKIFITLQFSADYGVNCELTPRQCKELLDHLEGLTRAATIGVKEILDALPYADDPTQAVIDGFKEYVLKGVETRVCSYCGLLMPDNQAEQMSDHVKHCASNPLVQEAEKLRAEVERLRGIVQRAEWVTEDDDVQPFCTDCGADQMQGHDDTCPFYQWEGGSHD